MHHSFDGLSEEIRRRKIEQMLLQHHVDIIRLMRERDLRPREWFGLPPHAADAFEGATQNLNLFIVEGFLDNDLDPSTGDGTNESTASLSVYAGAEEAWGDTGDNITVTNRDDHMAARSGERLTVYKTPAGEFRPLIWPPVLRLGKTDSSHEAGASGVVSVWEGTPGSESDSGDNVTAYNHFADLETTKWTVTGRIDGNDYNIAGEC